MRTMIFTLTFLGFGTIIDFSKLKGMGKLAPLYAIALFGIIASIIDGVAWIFHRGIVRVALERHCEERSFKSFLRDLSSTWRQLPYDIGYRLIAPNFANKILATIPVTILAMTERLNINQSLRRLLMCFVLRSSAVFDNST